MKIVGFRKKSCAGKEPEDQTKMDTEKSEAEHLSIGTIHKPRGQK